MILPLIKKIFIKCNIISMKNITNMNKHWIRVICDEETEKLVKAIYPEQLSAFEISGNRWQNLFAFKEYENKFFSEFYVLDIDNYTKKYDLIILEHVLEHLTQPYKAIQNLKNVKT